MTAGAVRASEPDAAVPPAVDTAVSAFEVAIQAEPTCSELEGILLLLADRCAGLTETARHLAQGKAVSALKELLAFPEPEARRVVRTAFVSSAPLGIGTRRNEITAPLLSEIEDTGDETVWIVEGYLGRGLVTIVAGHPKAGKTTWTANLAAGVAQGVAVIDRPLTRATVLWVDLEQHRSRTVRLFRALGVADAPIRLLNAPRWIWTTDALAGFIRAHDVGLVVIDALAKFWSGAVSDENDASQIEAAMTPIVALARETNAAVCAIHHARKSGGPDGLSVRGSSAVTAAADIIISFERYGGQESDQRLLAAVSRYAETPPRLVVGFQDGLYRALGAEGQVRMNAARTRLLDVLTSDPVTAAELVETTKIPGGTARTVLKELAESGYVTIHGQGKRGDPFRYSLAEKLSAHTKLLGAATNQETGPAE